MSKRLFDHHANEVEQERNERQQYVLQNASLDLKALAQAFFERFGLTCKSAAHDALRSSLIATGQEHLADETKVRALILLVWGSHAGDANPRICSLDRWRNSRDG